MSKKERFDAEDEEEYNPYRDAVLSNRKRIVLFVLMAAICIVLFLLYVAGLIPLLVVNIVVIILTLAMIVGYFKTRGEG